MYIHTYILNHHTVLYVYIRIQYMLCTQSTFHVW